MLDCSSATTEDVVLEIAEIYIEINLSPVDQCFTQNEGEGEGSREGFHRLWLGESGKQAGCLHAEPKRTEGSSIQVNSWSINQPSTIIDG